MENRTNYTPAENLEAFNFEIYTKNPETGEGGWDIKDVVVFGVTKSDAIEIMRRDVPNYDCVITSTASWNGVPLNDNERRHYEAGNTWYNTDNNLVN